MAASIQFDNVPGGVSLQLTTKPEKIERQHPAKSTTHIAKLGNRSTRESGGEGVYQCGAR